MFKAGPSNGRIVPRKAAKRFYAELKRIYLTLYIFINKKHSKTQRTSGNIPVKVFSALSGLQPV